MIYGELVKEQQMKDKDEIIAQINLNNYSDDNIVEEEKVEYGLDIGDTVNIIVYSNDGNLLPHFHVESTSKDKKSTNVNFCVCIYRANYFLHKGHSKQLNTSNMKELIKALKTPNKDGITLWERISKTWLKRFGNKYNENTFKMPDYYPSMSDISEDKKGKFSYDS